MSTITVVVLDDQNQPTAGANVSVSPSGYSGFTNASGEYRFELTDAKKYEITASYKSSTVTVPYYVTVNGAKRIVVNPTHVIAVEKQLNQVSWYKIGPVMTGGIILGVVIVLLLIWRFFKNK
jgi:hypothetical protein